MPAASKENEILIIPYEEKYRDDMIFMVLEAKNALGRVPTLNEDLLDVQKNYLDKGDRFWLAVDGHDRVMGCIGYNFIPGTTEVRLHRFYVKAARKRQGIGTRLLHIVELHLQEQGKTADVFHQFFLNCIRFSNPKSPPWHPASPLRPPGH